MNLNNLPILVLALTISSLLQPAVSQSLEPGEQVPSGVAESDSSASGSNCPDPIVEGSDSLHENYNSDIVFKDEEGTGADRYMTWKCSYTLDNLASLVSSEWSGVKLRVTEAWDEDYEHRANSLHYCGRAVDLTTSDRDTSKYGRLGQLVVDAGFDYVLYEASPAHIHASVKQCDSYEFACDNAQCIPSSCECDNDNDCGDNSDEDHCSGDGGGGSCASDQFRCNGGCIPSSWECDGEEDCSGEDEPSTCGGGGGGDGGIAGCFPPNATVLTPQKNVTMTNLEVGTHVLVLDKQGRLTYSPVIAFLNRNDKLEAKYVTVETEDEKTVTLTRSHLIHKANHNQANTSNFQKPEKASPVFASKLKLNDYIFTKSIQGNKVVPSKVVKIMNTKWTGAYAPLTLEGTIVVDSTLASCCALIDEHRLAHTTLASLRFLYRSMPSLLRERMGKALMTWYPTLLETVGRMVLDETHFHPSTVKHIVRRDN